MDPDANHPKLITVFLLYVYVMFSIYLPFLFTLQAAADACKLMGHRIFYSQMIGDQLLHQKQKITDLIDIATMKDYMQVGIF